MSLLYSLKCPVFKAEITRTRSSAMQYMPTINYIPLTHTPNCLITIERIVALLLVDQTYVLLLQKCHDYTLLKQNMHPNNNWQWLCVWMNIWLIKSALSAPDVKVKGEKGHYLLLVQGAETGGCKARLIHSANQVNGAVALATIKSLVQEKVSISSGTIFSFTHGRRLITFPVIKPGCLLETTISSVDARAVMYSA